MNPGEPPAAERDEPQGRGGDRACAEILAPDIYYDRNFGLEAVKILPGGYYVTSRDMALVTVLGSCVAACIYDHKLGIGGMNHFMLPDERRDSGDILSPSVRYGAYAMEIMINELIKMGVRRGSLEAKVFGGGNVLRGFTVNKIGQANAAFVLDYLEREGIPVTAQDLLGVHPRKVYYFPRSGRVLVKQLRGAHNDTVIAREQSYGARLRMSDVQGGVELF